MQHKLFPGVDDARREFYPSVPADGGEHPSVPPGFLCDRHLPNPAVGLLPGLLGLGLQHHRGEAGDREADPRDAGGALVVEHRKVEDGALLLQPPHRDSAAGDSLALRRRVPGHGRHHHETLEAGLAQLPWDGACRKVRRGQGSQRCDPRV